jgi:methyltransferase (TIGR00027 family)
MLTAAARAMHREERPPLVLDDDLALRLAGERGEELIERARTLLPGDGILSFSRWVCARARVTEDLVERLIPEGIGQYVILGAGLDSFAYRRHDLAGSLRVFEVDHPASQAWKRTRLSELGITPPRNLVFAPVDFETETLESGLRAAGFDFGSPAVFGWLGVTMYLTVDAIRATLKTVASCAAGTRIVLTYNQPTSMVDAFGRHVTTTLAGMVAETGEPFISLFTPDQIEKLMRREGYASIEHFGPEDAIRAYFPGRTDVRIANAQRVLIASVPDARPKRGSSTRTATRSPRRPG